MRQTMYIMVAVWIMGHAAASEGKLPTGILFKTNPYKEAEKAAKEVTKRRLAELKADYLIGEAELRADYYAERYSTQYEYQNPNISTRRGRVRGNGRAR